MNTCEHTRSWPRYLLNYVIYLTYFSFVSCETTNYIHSEVSLLSNRVRKKKERISKIEILKDSVDNCQKCFEIRKLDRLTFILETQKWMQLYNNA